MPRIPRVARFILVPLLALVTFAGGAAAFSSGDRAEAAPPWCGYTLTYGDNDRCVRVLQRALNRTIGAGLESDGSFGPRTLAAVKKFQSSRGLVRDGRVGPQTRTALGMIYH